MIVMKFGGTSVESAEAIQRVTEIVKSRLDRRPIVVVSAMGKTTNRLLKIADLAVSGQREEALRELMSLRDFHLRESGMERTVDEHFQELSELVKGLAVLGELTPRSIDAISSFGERLSSQRRTDGYRQVELNGVQRDRIRHVFAIDQRRYQCRVSRAAECLCQAGDERQAKYRPHMRQARRHQNGECRGAGHLNVLRDQQHLAPLDAVGNHAADQGK